MPFIKFTEEEKERANATSIADYLTAHGESVKRAGREYMWDAPSSKVSINGGEWYSQYDISLSEIQSFRLRTNVSAHEISDDENRISSKTYRIVWSACEDA